MGRGLVFVLFLRVCGYITRNAAKHFILLFRGAPGTISPYDTWLLGYGWL